MDDDEPVPAQPRGRSHQSGDGRRSGGSRPARGNRVGTPAVAASLAIVLVGLVAAIVLIPGLLPGALGSPTPGSSLSPGSQQPSGEAPSPTEVATFARPTATPYPTFTSHVVRTGESLNTIADLYRTTARSLAWWNRGAYPSLDPESADYEPDHIELGWVLVVIPGIVVDDANHPTASPGPPTPTPGPAATPSPAPSQTAGGPATVVSHGSRTSGEIALTFDMGGRLDPAVDIVGWLIDHGVHATLFPTGSAGTTTAEGMAALQLAATRPDLFAIGNHSWDHPDFTTLSADQMADELRSTDTAVHDLIGESTQPWFRPPFGAWSDDVRAGVGAAGWTTLVMWDIDTIDWKSTADGGPTADDIVTKVIANAKGGSIVLMHLGGWHTLEALPDLVAGLQSRGLTPVTLPEMLGG